MKRKKIAIDPRWALAFYIMSNKISEFVTFGPKHNKLYVLMCSEENKGLSRLATEWTSEYTGRYSADPEQFPLEEESIQNWITEKAKSL